jgi:hypothetical protein
MNITHFRDLPMGKRVAIAWAFLWRGIVATVGSAIGGGIAGGILGLLVGLANAALSIGTREQVAQLSGMIGACGGVAVAVVVWFFYVTWLFRASLAGFRLRLVTNADI